MPDTRGRILNRSEIADFLGRSLPTIDKWVSAGCPFVERGEKGREWRFNSADVVDWFERRAVDRATRKAPSGELDPAQERARKDSALADKAEMQNAIVRGNYVHVDDVVEHVGSMFSVCRNKLLSLPTKSAGRVPMAVAATVEENVRDVVYECLTELSEDTVLEKAEASTKRRKTP
ncbi:terminase small subunit [Methylobacterium sp. WL19]|uniref:terminase small subunit n=1 Tax=Methylobacterium sp. WL19 TaxID=2603896 RepID=UPI0011CC497D|nr:terminase small subunit [Methylobacterium sp. WL19]TXN27134.1 terminase small subunit [Methylobacterium sp. WL19]